MAKSFLNQFTIRFVYLDCMCIRFYKCTCLIIIIISIGIIYCVQKFIIFIHNCDVQFTFNKPITSDFSSLLGIEERLATHSNTHIKQIYG